MANFPIPHPRGFRAADNERKCTIKVGQDEVKVSDVVLQLLIARMTGNNGATHEFETIYDSENQLIEVDIPECFLDFIETVEVGPNINRYLNWLVGAVSVNAEDVTYDNSGTGLTSEDVQAAIDEIFGLLGDESLWDRTGNVLTTQNPGDDVHLGGELVVADSVTIGDTANPTSPSEGEIKYNGGTFSGYDGVSWQEFGDGIPEFANMRTVSIGGDDAQYTSIQAAIDSITDASSANEYVVLVYPGTYEEELVIPSHITLFGHSRTKGPLIKSTGSANPLITINDNNGTGSVGFRHIGFELEEPLNNASIFLCADTASYSAVSCRMNITRTSDNVTAMFSDHTGSGFARFNSCLFTFNILGTSATAKNHKLFNVRGNSHIVVLSNKIDVNVADENDNFSIVDNSSNDIDNINIITYNRISADFTHASYSGETHFYFTNKKDVQQEIGYNYCRFDSAGGVSDVAEFFHIDAGTGAVVKSIANSVRLNGFSSEVLAYVAVGDTFISHFDDVAGSTGILTITGGGTFDHVYSPSDGSLKISESLSVGAEISAQSRVDFYGGTPWTNKSIMAVKHDDPGVGVAATFDTVTSSDINSGKAMGVRQIGQNFQSGVWYSNGTIGFGPGTGARDIFISRSAAGEISISDNPFSPADGGLRVYGYGIFGDSVVVGDTPNPTSPTLGEIRYSGSDLEGYVGGTWKSLTAGNIGGARFTVVRIDNTDSPYTASYGEFIRCDCSAGPITVNLPTASGNSGKELNIIKIDSTSNQVTLDAFGTETIRGELTQSIALQWDSVTLVSIDDGVDTGMDIR